MTALNNLSSLLNSAALTPPASSSTSSTNNSNSTSSSSSTPDAFANLSSSDFIQIMMSELQNQDPLQPEDASSIMDQISSLRSIESNLQLQQSMSSLVLAQQISQAGGLIGKTVTGLDASNNSQTGVVTSVAVQNGQAMLQLDTGSAISMSNVTQIANTAASSTTSTTSTGTTGTSTTAGTNASTLLGNFTGTPIVPVATGVLNTTGSNPTSTGG